MTSGDAGKSSRNRRPARDRRRASGERANTCPVCGKSRRSDAKTCSRACGRILRYGKGVRSATGACASCGKPIKLGKGSAAEPRCRPCHDAAGGSRGGGRPPKYPPLPASAACEVCGAAYTPRRQTGGGATRTCGRTCGAVLRKGAQLALVG